MTVSSHTLFRIAVFVVVAALLPCVVAHANDTQTQAAKDAFSRGKTHFENSEFDKAAASFRIAWELNPSWKLLYNIGQAEAAAKRYGLALEAFESYLSQGGDGVPEDRRAEVNNELARLRQMVGSLDITAPKGADIIIDGVKRGTAPLPGLLKVAAAVNHEFKAVFNRKLIESRNVRVSVGDVLRITVDMPTNIEVLPTAPPPVETSTTAVTETKDEPGVVSDEPTGAVESDDAAAPAAPAKQVSPGRSLRISGWVTAGVGVALLGTGSAFGGMALSLDSDVASRCQSDPLPDPLCQTNNQSDIDQSQSYATVSTVLIISGGAAVAAGATMIVLGYLKKSKSDVAISPWFSGTVAGATLGRSF